MLPPTPFPELNALLTAFVEGVQDALGEAFVSAYLQGSFAVGDYDEHSDADFIVAVRDRPDDAQVNRLQTLHAHLHDSKNPWKAHLEGSYLPLAVLRTCARRTEPVWYMDRGHRVLVPGTHCNTAVVRRVSRQHGIPLAGADPATLIDPVPLETLRAEIMDTMGAWAQEILDRPEAWANQFYQGFIVLNYSRAWCDLCTGTVGSKRRGAEWAKARLGTDWTDLIDRAWSTRPNAAMTCRTPADPHDYQRTLDFLRIFLQQTRSEFGVPLPA